VSGAYTPRPPAPTFSPLMKEVALTQIVLEEQVIPGMRLGRHINHDPRSRAFGVEANAASISSVLHTRVVPIFDQGNIGSCTGNASVGALGTAPLFDTLPASAPHLDEDEAVRIYSAATKVDSFGGSYPPEDTGSDGLSVAKVLKSLGLISGYQHAFSLTAALTALQSYPVITGVNWYEGMDSPDAHGLVKVSGQLRGGHEFEVVGVDAEAKTVRCANSWGTSYGDNGYFTMTWSDWDRLLGEQGDVTVLLPLTVPAPTPTPTPAPVPVPDADPADEAFAHILQGWLANKPFFYKDLQRAAKVWLNTL